MLVNVTDVFTSEGKVLAQEFAWETAEITHDGSSYPVKSTCGSEAAVCGRNSL